MRDQTTLQYSAAHSTMDNLALYNCSPGVHAVSHLPPAWQLGHPVGLCIRRVCPVPEQLLTAQQMLYAPQKGHSASRAARQQEKESAAERCSATARHSGPITTNNIALPTQCRGRPRPKPRSTPCDSSSTWAYTLSE